MARGTDVNVDTPVSGSLSVFILSSEVAGFAPPPAPPTGAPFLLLPGQINSAPPLPHSAVALDGQLISASFVP